jgi:choline-sulfatase
MTGSDPVVGGAMLRRIALALTFSLARTFAASGVEHPDVVLITLDTTRADYVGKIVDGRTLTPRLDALARGGVSFARALSPVPLTLPAHCTLMTGRNPPGHGVHDNGATKLPADVPTLAGALREHGYVTGAFVSSLVLDRRFGLDRGFDVYDDAMVAERTGEQGYPERDASAVTDAALAWVRKPGSRGPRFLWVHYYDPHAPYQPPGFRPGDPPERRYAGEVAYVDANVGRLLDGLPASPSGRIVAVVGDHGEMLGEHGEKEHGIFLYRSALDVPLILSGPGIPAGRRVEETVGTRGLAAALITLAGYPGDAALFGPALTGLGAAPSGPEAGVPVYGETLLPETAYGWSPLHAATDGRWRLIVAPRPELYDLADDPGETKNIFGQRPEEARRLRQAVAAEEAKGRTAPAAPGASEFSDSLRSLGYLSGSRPRPGGGMDPKDGIRLLEEFDQAKALTRKATADEAVRRLQDLVRRSPGNVPFLFRLAEAQVVAGQSRQAAETLESAIALNPGLDFLHARRARILMDARRYPEAQAEWEATLAVNPRHAQAWLGLAETAVRTGSSSEEITILERGEAAGTRSAAIQTRLAQLELASGRTEEAARHADDAVRWMPDVGMAWWVAGEVEEKKGHADAAIERYEKAALLGFGDSSALVHLGRLLLEHGRAADGRAYLQRAIALGPGTPSADEARRLLAAP